MKILGIDTSGYANAIGVVDGNRILADYNFEARTDSLEKIVANIDFVLKEAGLTLKDIQGFGVGLGPGSWTGIRVGVTVAKMLAFSTGCPLAGTPTLELLADNVREMGAPICPVIYAGTGDMVYAAIYRAGNGVLTRVGDYYVGDIQGLLDTVREATVFLGSGAQRYRDLIDRTLGSLSIDAEVSVGIPMGATAARLAVSRLESGQSDDVLALQPLYLKESTARAFVNKYSGKGQA